MPTALVTGASRGMGKVVAVYLARAGFDVAVTARTVDEGEEWEQSTTIHRSEVGSYPGSLTVTAELIEREGVRALAVPADLTDRGSMFAAADAVLAAWGGVDVLVNCGRYVGPGHDDKFVDTSLEALDLHMEANVMAPLALIKRVLPGMLERGSGYIINVSSGVAWLDPPAPAGEGGWGLSYAYVEGCLAADRRDPGRGARRPGIQAYNLQPGAILTERRTWGAARDHRRRRAVVGDRSEHGGAQRSQRRGPGCLSRARPARNGR